MLFFSIILIWTIESGFGQICTQEGFFRNPTNCKKFYRCVDLWQNGRELTIYHFNCPVGTVFDETVSICNWPQLAAPCDEMTTAPIQIATTETSQQGMSGGDPEVGGNGETVILKPSFSFQCRGEGLFEHANDCSKFWVCEPVDGDEDTKQSVIESKLFVCPDNYWVSRTYLEINIKAKNSNFILV